MEVVTKKSILKDISNILKEMTYFDIGDILPKNKEISYGIDINHNRIFFDNKSKLNEFIKENNMDKKCAFKVEYIGKCNEHDNVIKVIRFDRVDLYNIVDEYTYFKHNKEKSLEFNTPMWEFKYGNISDYYRSFNRKVKTKELIYR